MLHAQIGSLCLKCGHYVIGNHFRVLNHHYIPTQWSLGPCLLSPGNGELTVSDSELYLQTVLSHRRTVIILLPEACSSRDGFSFLTRPSACARARTHMCVHASVCVWKCNQPCTYHSMGTEVREEPRLLLVAAGCTRLAGPQASRGFSCLSPISPMGLCACVYSTQLCVVSGI